MGEVEKLREETPDLPADERGAFAHEVLGGIDDFVDDDPAEAEAAWADEIRRRVEEIRNGTAELYDLEDVLAEMDQCESEVADEPMGSADLDDGADVEAAWGDEIKRRVDEIRDGTAQTYAAEDVMAALRFRFG
jgi:hypothetical protein